jgi:predicted O-linked N-acetylglucosamine transferase (SPINDLY family)
VSLLARLFGSFGPGRSAAHWCAQGTALFQAQRWSQAAQAFEQALLVDPECAAAHSGLGMARMRLGDRRAALAPLLRAADAEPANRDLALLVAELLLKTDRSAEAQQRLASLAADGRDAAAGYLSGLALRALGTADEATRYFERFSAQHPGHAAGLEALAALHRDAGRIEEAIELYRRLVTLRPELAGPASAVLFHQQYREHDRAALHRAHLDWGKRFAPAMPVQAFANAPLPERPLVLGYVSADFNLSSAAPFIEPLLRGRDREAFRVVCYSASTRADQTTRRLRAQADLWRDIDGVSDERAAALVREDGVDILVDLNGHTRGGRLGLFALRAAPVQASYLGYGATTGVAAIDYRISDPWIDPPGVSEQYYCERLVRLSRSLWCFLPPAAAPDPGALPALANGFVTFASLNNFSKISARVLALWARLLAALPHSRLVIAGAAEGEPTRRAAAAFAAAGVAASRLTFRSRASHDEFLAQHRQLDIALDSFPYSGGATTCDALWMGVPTITLAGDAVLARSGLSILGAVGLQQWVAQDEADYLARAIAQASDPAALAALRSGLRARVAASALCDVGGFAAAMETQLRWMWRQWCSQTT